MMTTTTPTLNGRKHRSWGALLLLATLPVACVLGATLLGPQDWNSSRGPVVPHDTFPADCRLCHVGDAWHEIREDFEYDHAKETGVALHGAHEQAECLRCHNDRGPVAQFAVRGCAGCHVDPHQRRLGTNCRDCHDERDWRPREQIAKHNRTRFALVGSHAAVACHRCHPGAQVGNFQRADARCESCHADDLGRARQPDHASLGWTSDCGRCHRATAWSDGGFAHQTFPLLGAHRSTNCTNCHKNNVFRGTPRQCVDCHRAEFDRTTRPNHAGAGFSTQCQTCHSPISWNGAGFIHRWPLTGRHAAARCAQCHVGNIYKGTPTACIGCHQADYDRTTTPNHKGAGFSTQCQTCHTTSAWTGAGFVHQWPLTGKHKAVDCAQCHVGNVYKGTPKDCASCHLDDYNATTNPDHKNAGFPTSCQICHNTNGWPGAVFNHAFPLKGKHNVACATCHTQPTNYKVFTCLVCHDHNKTKMDDKHKNKPGYVYSSAACYQCHPNGK